MKNKTVKMVLAVVVLGVCCGAYAGVKTYVAHQEQKESEEDSEESTTVFTASTDNIKSLDFMVDDTETTFEKDDDSWVKKDETDFPVNQTTLDSAASAIASVDSDRVLEDVDDLSEYGLDSPSNTIKIVTKSDEEDGDDITTTLYVGDENSSTSQYYVRKDDDEKTVYLIDSSCVEPFTKSLNVFICHLTGSCRIILCVFISVIISNFFLIIYCDCCIWFIQTIFALVVAFIICK